jgi:4-amino-4-deoxy-L-arabinose transferase-like glycosyltransferase
VLAKRAVKRLIPYTLAALLLLAGFLSLHQYNVTWDEALGDLFFGQRYFSFFTTFDHRYLDFAANPPLTPDLTSSPFRIRPWEHYPVASALAFATSKLFRDPFDGFHAFNLLIGAAFLILFYRWIESRRGTLAALAATLFLFLAPRIAGDAMTNVKDFSEMVFFSAAAIAWFLAIERDSPRATLAAGILFGLALGTKANALFLPPIVLAYAAARRPSRRIVIALFGSFAIGAVVFFASWPYLWSNPLQAIKSNLIYSLVRKSGTSAVNTVNPFTMIAFTTPPTFLLAVIAGLVPLARRVREREPFALFITCWLVIVMARLALPAAVNFDGVRHFLELFPPPRCSLLCSSPKRRFIHSRPHTGTSSPVVCVELSSGRFRKPATTGPRRIDSVCAGSTRTRHPIHCSPFRLQNTPCASSRLIVCATTSRSSTSPMRGVPA